MFQQIIEADSLRMTADTQRRVAEDQFHTERRIRLDQQAAAEDRYQAEHKMRIEQDQVISTANREIVRLRNLLSDDASKHRTEVQGLMAEKEALNRENERLRAESRASSLAKVSDELKIKTTEVAHLRELLAAKQDLIDLLQKHSQKPV